MNRCLVVILGGGRGTRLHPLTKMRSKPAVPLGGSYRLIDIPISNCINSGYQNIFVLTQYNSASLHRHISQSYKFDIFSGGFVEILAAEQTVSRSDWYQGTADAVRQNLRHFLSYDFDYYLILAGDHLYRMDYRKFVQFHARKGADISVAVYPVDAADASGFGILKIDSCKRIVDFVEKPRDPKTLSRMRVPGRGHSKSSKDYLASMGIYVFSRKTLHEVLANEEHTDFGRDIIPSSLSQRRVVAFPFTGYWRDIGTIRAFFDANIEMAQPNPPFPFHTEEGPIYTHPRFLQGSRIEDCQIRHSTIAPGGTLCGAMLNHCVIGIRSTVSRGCLLDHVVMMGADYREWPGDKAANRKAGIPNIGIGESSRIRNAIIDKNARIGENVVIENREGIIEAEGQGYAIRDGIVVIEKSATIPSGTVI